MAENKDFSKMSDQELLDLYHKDRLLANTNDLAQKAMKILLNSVYGALGSPYFLYYNINIAKSITLSGQTYIKKSANEALKYLAKTTNKPYNAKNHCAGDTDSVESSTIVNVRKIQQ